MNPADDLQSTTPSTESGLSKCEFLGWLARGLAIAGGAAAIALFTGQAPPAVAVAASPLDHPRQLAAFNLVERSGRNVTQTEFAGKFVVVNFIFTSCSLSCRVVNDRMAEIQGRVASASDVQLVSLTVDPRSDTPAMLTKFADRYHADARRWLFLTGDPTEVYRLIQTSFISRSPGLEQFIPGGFTNTDRIMLVDPCGEVFASFNGLTAAVAPAIVAEIEKRRKVPALTKSKRDLCIIRIDSPGTKSLHDRHMRLKILCVTSIGLILLGMEVAKGAEVAPAASVAATNIPTPNLQSSTPANSLAMLLQVVKQLEHCVQTTNLSSIHNEDMILSAASSELLTQADLVTADHTDEFKSALTVFCQKVSTLHLAADLSRQAQAEAVLREVVESFQKVKGYFSQEIIAAAQPSVDAFTCPIHRDVVGKKSDFCPKCGTKLDQFCRILPAGYGFPLAGQPGIRASVHTLTPLTVGQPVSAILRLEKPNGLPVLPADLIETHTTRIHLLIVDTSLTDYHHEHPQPTRAPGDYAFGFVPRKPGSYRVWADLRPYPLGLQEYAQAYIVAATPPEPLTDRAVKLKTTVDGFDFELIPGSEAIHVGRPAAMKLRITTPDGKGFTQLEPVMETFAHLVGFNEDHKTVLHLHPKGESVMDPTARGGPELEFILYAMRPGFVRLFAQVQIEGRPRFAPFGLQVRP